MNSAGPIRVMRIIARLNIGGPAVHVSLLTAGLQDPEFQSTLVTGSLSETEGDMSYLAEELGVEPIVIPSMGREISPFDDLRTLRALIRLMREQRPHVVHTHTAKAGFVGRLAAFLTGVPVVIHTFHGHVFHGYFGKAKTQMFLWLERGAARISDVILTISERLRDELLGYRIAPPDRIKVVPLGLPLTRLRVLEPLRGQLCAELGFSTEDRLVGIIGRLVPIKDHALFLRAARRTLERVPRTRFLIIGDGELRSELVDLVAEMRLEEAVTFTGWRTDLPRVYADLDAVVISSRNEGTPVSLIEAMAAGVPVVSTSVGGVPDVLQQGRLGYLAPPGDMEALAEGMVQAITQPAVDTLKAAQAWALEQYDADRLIRDVRALYRRELQRKGFDLPVQMQATDLRET